MRRFVLSLVAALAATCGAAQAQTARTADFSGFEIGPDLGVAFGSTSGLAGGAHAGYNFQMGSFVVGGEADALLANFTGSGSTSLSQHFLGSIRAKAGFAFGDFLLYGTAGPGWGAVQYSNWFGTHDTTVDGIVFGVGAEYALTRNLSLRAEFLSYQFGDVSYTAIPFYAGSESATVNMARIGANFRF